VTDRLDSPHTEAVGLIGRFLYRDGFLGEARLGTGLGEVEDDEIIAILDGHKAELLARSEDSPDPAL
jgi:hypothetical protein